LINHKELAGQFPEYPRLVGQRERLRRVGSLNTEQGIKVVKQIKAIESHGRNMYSFVAARVAEAIASVQKEKAL
jgi:hypothetical protein